MVNVDEHQVVELVGQDSQLTAIAFAGSGLERDGCS
jgi:hypothetical protein